MLQAYSSSLSVAANAAFPFNNVTVDKGCAENLSAPASIQLNQRGVYLVEVDGFATGAAGDISNFGFKSFVQVTENNCNCNCASSPTVLQVLNGDVALTDAHINVVVTKIR